MRRVSVLWVLCVAVAVWAGAGGVLGSASASSTPVQMNYACALKSNGLMRYASSPAQCGKNWTAVTILPGPVYACVHKSVFRLFRVFDPVFKVAALSNCPTPKNLVALTLPPSSAPVYFCASNRSGVLAYTTDPSSCRSQQFPVVVRPNTVTVTNPGNQTSTVGTAVSLQIPATDSASGQTLTYSATGLPAGLSINSSTGLISGTPTTAGTSSVTVTATDTTGAHGSAAFTWTVNPPNVVTVTNPGNQTSTVGTAVSLQIPATDSASGQTLTYSATGLPAGLSINSSTGLISGTPTTAGTSSVTVTATDTTGAHGSAAFTWTVNPPNVVTVTNPGNQTSTVGTAVSLQIPATDSASGQTLTYSATGLPAGLSINSSTGLISGTPTTAGTSSVTVTATDTTGAHGSASFTWTVNPQAQPPTAQNQSYTAVGNTPLAVGTTVTGPAATLSASQGLLNGDSGDASCGTLSVTGNTTPTHGTVTVNPDGTFTYTPAPGFSGADTFQYTITCSNSGKTATATVTITVGPVVWYVDNSKAAAGNGEASSPFNTLAAANSAAGANSIIFLYQGNATYTGGASMTSGEDLFGQPHGLTVDGYSLVPAGGSNPTITNSGGNGIALGEGSDVEAVNVSNPSGNGIAASGVNSATVGGSNAVAISDAGGDGIHISGGNGNLNFANTTVTGSAGHSVSLANHTGGNTDFGGNITDNTTGITLSDNTGATINFTGKITATTGTNTAFNAAGGGTITATGGGSTLTTTTATVLNVANTTIGSGGLSFQSVSSNGANPGMNLSSTGSSGGLSVTGTGSAGSGGTIQASSGEGINLSSTSSPSFTDMIIENNAADGINGSSVNGFTLARSTVSGNGTAANESGQNNDGLDFTGGLTGTVTVANSSVTNSADSGLQVTDNSGSLNLTITDSTFSGGGPSLTSTTDPTLGDGVEILANGPTNATASVTGSTFTDNGGYQFDLEPTPPNGTASGTNSVTFNNNTLSNSTGYGNGGGVNLLETGSSTTSLNIKNNNIQGASHDGIALAQDGTTSFSGTVDSNTVGSPTTSCSGSVQGSDIAPTTRGSSTATLAITNNKLYQYDNPAGIAVINDEGSATTNLTITGNTIADPVPATVKCPTQAGPVGALWGLWLVSGGQTGDTNTTCVNISGNSMTGSAPSAGGIDDFEFDETGNGIFKLPGYTGGSNDSNAVVSFVQDNNTPSGGSAPSGDTVIQGTGSGGGIFFAASSCPTPP